MSYITYEVFKERVKEIVFPEGEAENLVSTHNSYIVEALINLQTNIPCLRENNVDVYTKEDVREQCNADFVTGPRGVIQAVYAFLPGSDCARYFYDARNQAFVDCWMAKQSCVTCNDQTDDDEPSITRSPECHTEMAGDTACASPYEEADEDDSTFQGSKRYYAIGPNQKLILAPRFPCGYKVVVHWEGVKRSYDESDVLPDDMDLITTVAKFVEGQKALRLDKDRELYERLMHPVVGEFTVAKAAMVVRCNRERRTPDQRQCFDGFGVVSALSYDPMGGSVDNFAYIGDWGLIGSNGLDVEELVESWSPDFIVSAGDNIYDPAADFAEVFASFTYYGSMVDEELFYPAIGNHDLDDGGGLADFQATFTYLNHNATRNYSVRKKNVEFFFMETHDTGTAPPDLDTQASWLAGALAASTARFKVVVTQDPPYNSDVGVNNYPGHEDSQLDYAGLGADIVLSGDSHYYERLLVDGFPYIICGLSGATKNNFNAVPVTGSLVRYNTLYGAVRGTATTSSLKLEFINTAGQVVDKLTLRK